MSISALSSLTSGSSVLSLLGENSTPSTTSGLLGTSSNSTDAVTVDLSNYEQAVSSGDSSEKSSALNQLKQDMASAQTALLSTLTGAGTPGADVGDTLLSNLFGGSTGSSSGSILDTIA